MIKWWIVPLAAAGVLFAYEDVSFSARTLGLGGDQAAVADDAFSSITNPALPARWMRPVTVNILSMELATFWAWTCMTPATTTYL